jgi:predicted SAM-dependent methyltransferase
MASLRDGVENLPLAKRARTRAVRVKRFAARTDHRLIETYQEPVRKLHLGCGYSHLDGWLNSDYFPVSDDVLALDVTRRFPFDDNSFDYVFSEHMIEHVCLTDGLKMLAECFRVLRLGGCIRISTPDLQFLIDLRGKRSDVQDAYVKWSAETFLPHISGISEEVRVINNFVRDWGHQFIYDESILREALESQGFSELVRCELNRSADENLRDLENESRAPAGFIGLETMTIEARKI